ASFPLHPMRRLLHRRARLRLGQRRGAGRHRLPSRGNRRGSSRPLHSLVPARPNAARKSERGLRLLRERQGLHRLPRPAAPVPHLALLGKQRRHAGTLGAHLFHLSRLGSGRINSFRRNHPALEDHPSLADNGSRDGRGVSPSHQCHPTRLPPNGTLKETLHMSWSRTVAYLTLTLPALPRALSAAEPTAKSSFTKDVAPFLAAHCTKCHSGAKPKGDLALDKFADETAALKDRQTWERVAENLRSGDMPPPGR